MKQFEMPQKNELVQICLLYRYFSLALSTIVYFIINNWEITLTRLGTALGMIIASILGAYLYKKNFSESAKAGLIITMCLEIVAYGLFIVFSGGFSSPYLWYFISSLTIVLAAARSDKRFRVMAALALIWVFACAVAGGQYGLAPGNMAHSAINTSIAFLVVAGGFYILFLYVGRLDQNQQELNDLNQRLRCEMGRSEQALRHTMDIYESFNLFSIMNPGKVMTELTALLYRAIAPEGCLLLKINPPKGIKIIGSCGLDEKSTSALLEHITELEFGYPKVLWPSRVDILGRRYVLRYINSPSGIMGILIAPYKETAIETEGDKAQQQFYLNLAGIIMQELDLQAAVESYIISEEQNRIANEIHDTVIQKLFGIACSLRLLDKQQEAMGAQEINTQIRQIGKSVESTMRELRETIYGLRWDADGPNEFTEKLSQYMYEVTCLSGAAVNLMLDREIQQMTANQKTAFYRVICEAVNNAVRHGKATGIDIRMSMDELQLQAEISDNGQGFDQRRLPDGGLGIINMYKIVGLLKGQLSIESKIGQGTIVRCSLPK